MRKEIRRLVEAGGTGIWQITPELDAEHGKWLGGPAEPRYRLGI